MRFWSVFYLVICLSWGCHKLVGVSPPDDQIAVGNTFTKDQGEAAIIGVYSSMMDNVRSMVNGGLSIYGGMSSDELSRTVAYASEDAFALDVLDAMNGLCSNLYTSGYGWIYDCNNILEKVSSESVDSGLLAIRAEAAFTRAFIYFYLVNLYGDVPLVTMTDYHRSSVLPRSPVGDVYGLIESDLQYALATLPVGYVTVASRPLDRVRPNRACAAALLARVYCYLGNWQAAIDAASLVIGDVRFGLESNLDRVFLSDSREAIWQLMPVHAHMSTAEGISFIPALGRKPMYALTTVLMHDWASGDLRLRHWVGVVGNYSYPYKYKLSSDTPLNREYNCVLRLAEQYLIRAEARTALGDSVGGAADLTVVRKRAGLGAVLPESSSFLLQAIAHERRCEFFAEWGHRWLDLKRSGHADAVLGALKPGWRPTAVLYPIPYVELIHNPYLVQNPGY